MKSHGASEYIAAIALFQENWYDSHTLFSLLMQFPVLIYQDEDGVYIGEVPTLRGVGSFGKTIEELNKNLKEAIELYLEEKAENIPERQYSFEFLSVDASTQNNIRKKTYHNS